MATILETPRLTIRHFTLEDLDALTIILGNPKVMEFSLKGPLSREETQDWLQTRLQQYEHPGFSLWALIHKTDNKLIGFCGIAPLQIDGHTEIEIGYRLDQIYWGQGLATEACEACRDYAFNKLAFSRIIAIVEPQNTRSVNVIDKLGMTYEKDTLYAGISVRFYILNRPTRPGQAFYY